MRFRRLSAPGAAALSSWHLEAAPEHLEQLCGRRLPELDVPVRVRLPDGAGGILDEGVLWLRSAPAPEAQAELHLHGGYGAAAALRARLAQLGWSEQSAAPDPDLARLLHSRGPLNARAAGALLDGAFERRCAELEAAPAPHRAQGLAQLERWSAWAELLEQPPRIVLAGPPNSGKSSLFNAWLRAERVTVSPHPGTTRDAVEASLLLGAGEDAFEVRLVDTAGLWDASEELDRAAVAAAGRVRAGAWRVLWVLDASTPPGAPVLRALAQARPADLRLLHRTDLGAAWEPGEGLGGLWLRGSLHAQGPALLAHLEQALLAPLGPPPPPGTLLPLGPERRRRLQALRSP